MNWEKSLIKESWEPQKIPPKDLNKKINLLWAIYCAEAVLHIFEDKYPDDDRPRKAIEAAKNYLKHPTEENRNAANAAYAYAAYTAYDDAAYAAYDAAYYAAYYAAAYAAYAAAAAKRADPNLDTDALKEKAKQDIGQYIGYTTTSSIKISDFELDKSKGIEEPSEGLSVQPLTKMMMQRRQLNVGDLLIAEEDLIGPDPYKSKESFQYFTADHEYPFAGYTDTKWPTPGLAVKTDYQDQLMVVCFDPVPKLMEPREMQWAEKFSVVVESPENKEQKKMFDEYREVPVKILEEALNGKGIASIISIGKKVTEDLHVRENLSLNQAKKLVEDSFEFLDAFNYIRISEYGAFYLTPKGRKFLESLG